MFAPPAGNPTTDPVAGLRAAVDAVASEDRGGWSGAARSAHLVELLAVRDRAESEVLRALGEWDAAAAFAEEGSMTPVGWLAENAPMTRRDAADLLRTARLAHAHPRTAAALRAGDIAAANVALMARAARHREVVFDDQEDTLLDAASELPPEQFRRLARRWQSLADDHLDRAAPDLQDPRWHLHASTTFGGAVAVRGLLDPEGGAIVLAALDALDAPDATEGARPARTLPQRRADALVALAEGTGGSRRVNLDVIVDLATVNGESPTDLEGFRRELVGIGPIGQATLERLACDSNVGRVVMRGKSLIVDLGRYTPVVSPAQRRALAIRDGGCVEPGCSAPPEWCDAHHTDPWTLGGPTDLDQLELRCRRHHVEAHGGKRGPHQKGEPRPPPSRSN
jgi:hypothetical protein